MREKDLWHKILKGAYNYLLFFILVAFLVTCTTSLFVHTLSNSLAVDLTKENISVAAKLTFANVIVLSVLFTFVDFVRRKLTIDKAVNHIISAAKKVVKGDFSVRIKPVNNLGIDENFNEIIDCFNKMTRELQSVEILRNDFISNVSHEMKTPLTVIQNYGTLLQTPDLTEEKRIEYAKGVTMGARRMSDMMINILKLNRLENQQIFTQVSEFDLGEQLCQCLLQHEHVWEASGIEIEANIEENVVINADAELLSLVWNNLLSNAFKFTDAGGTVSVTLKSTEDFAIVKIKDTGIGMSPDVGTHIFEKFYQGDSSRSMQGNGLGLALVKRVIDIMKGEISVESALGVGSTFTVKVPKSI